MDIFDVIHDVAGKYPGGVVALAHRMECNAGTLTKKLLPDDLTHNLTVRELRQIITYTSSFTKENLITRALASEVDLICIEKINYEGLSDKEILDLFLELQAKQGDWSREIGAAIANGGITYDEWVAINAYYMKFLTAAAELMSRLLAYMGKTEERSSRIKNV